MAVIPLPDAVRKSLRGLYAITPDCLAANVLLDRVRAALQGGAAFVQHAGQDCITAESDSRTAGGLFLQINRRCHE